MTGNANRLRSTILPKALRTAYTDQTTDQHVLQFWRDGRMIARQIDGGPIEFFPRKKE